jgi:hypothetical protein
MVRASLAGASSIYFNQSYFAFADTMQNSIVAASNLDAIRANSTDVEND